MLRQEDYNFKGIPCNSLYKKKKKTVHTVKEKTVSPSFSHPPDAHEWSQSPRVTFETLQGAVLRRRRTESLLSITSTETGSWVFILVIHQSR